MGVGVLERAALHALVCHGEQYAASRCPGVQLHRLCASVAFSPVGLPPQPRGLESNPKSRQELCNGA